MVRRKDFGNFWRTDFTAKYLLYSILSEYKHYKSSKYCSYRYQLIQLFILIFQIQLAMINQANSEDFGLVLSLLEQYIKEKIENNQIIAYSLIKKYNKSINNAIIDNRQQQRTIHQIPINSKLSCSHLSNQQSKKKMHPPQVQDNQFEDKVLERLILIQQKVNCLKLYKQKQKQKEVQQQVKTDYNKMYFQIGQRLQPINNQIRRTVSYRNIINEDNLGQKQQNTVNEEQYIISIKPVLQNKKENIEGVKVQNSSLREIGKQTYLRRERKSEKINEKSLMSSRTMTYLPMTLQSRLQISAKKFERENNFRQLQKSSKKRAFYLQRSNRVQLTEN